MPPARTTRAAALRAVPPLTLTTPLQPLPPPLRPIRMPTLLQHRPRRRIPAAAQRRRRARRPDRRPCRDRRSACSCSRRATSDGACSGCSCRAARTPASRSARASARCWSSSRHATAEQVAEAVEEQERAAHAEARRHPASSSRSSRRSSCSKRSTQQPRCRWCASARRCCRSAWSRERSSNEALAQQQLDRSVPLGEMLVRDGRGLARGPADRAGAQDGLSAGRRRRLSRSSPRRCASCRSRVARALQVLPLLLRDGRLVVALDDPSRRAAIDEIEFVADMKVVPVLAPRRRSIETALRAGLREGRRAGTERRRPAAPIQCDRDFEPSDADQLRRVARAAGSSAEPRRRRRDADRAERQLAGAADQHA